MKPANKLCCLTLGILSNAAMSQSQGFEPMAIPPSVGITFSQTSTDTNKHFKIDNHSAQDIVAFSYTGKCMLHNRIFSGHGDAALIYGEPLKSGISQSISSGDSSCEAKLESVIFSDGHSYGNPTAIMAIKKRRQHALKELKPLEEILLAETNSPQDLQPDVILSEIASRLSLIPGYTAENEDEIDSRRQVLSRLHDSTKFLRDHLSSKDDDKKNDFYVYRLLVADWIKCLTSEQYPNQRFQLTIGRNP